MKTEATEPKTYTFRIVVEPDEDRWFAYCPVLESYGGATWSYTKEEALKPIEDVVRMVVEGMGFTLIGRRAHTSGASILMVVL